jgi:hypothetical protein
MEQNDQPRICEEALPCGRASVFLRCSGCEMLTTCEQARLDP